MGRLVRFVAALPRVVGTAGGDRARGKPRYAGRPAAASPATGPQWAAKLQQMEALIAQALD